MLTKRLGPRTKLRGALSPIILVTWLWAGLLTLLLLYLRALASSVDPEVERHIALLWWQPTAQGLPLRYGVKLVNLLLALLLWLRFRSARWWRERRPVADTLLYLGSAALLVALEWACHLSAR